MSNAVVLRHEAQVVHSDHFTEDQKKLIKEVACPRSTDTEMKLFLTQCARTSLDPLARQIYAIKRYNSQEEKEVLTIQVSIDGFRLTAQRTGKYAGQLGPYWSDGKLYPVYDANGKEVSQAYRWLEAWNDKAPPALAKVAVLHNDFKEPLWAVARYSTYVQLTKGGSPNFFWQKMPDLLLAKAAECLAIRKAFPMELSGIYEPVEMPDNPQEGAAVSATAKKSASPAGKRFATPKQVGRLKELLDGAGPDETEQVKQILAKYKLNDYSQLSEEFIGQLIGKLEDRRKSMGGGVKDGVPTAAQVERLEQLRRDLGGDYAAEVNEKLGKYRVATVKDLPAGVVGYLIGRGKELQELKIKEDAGGGDEDTVDGAMDAVFEESEGNSYHTSDD